MGIIESLDYNIQMIKQISNSKKIIKLNVEELLRECKNLEARLIDVKDSRMYYTDFVDEVYQHGIGALKDTINGALRDIIFDKHYEVDLVLEDKRGTKSLSIVLIDKETGLEVAVTSGCGNGVRTIISFVLKVYYLINRDSNVLVLDEKYSALSEEYVDNFFQFMSKMAEEKDFIIILITHDNRFIPYANKIYLVSDGNISVFSGSSSSILLEQDLTDKE